MTLEIATMMWRIGTIIRTGDWSLRVQRFKVNIVASLVILAGCSMAFGDETSKDSETETKAANEHSPLRKLMDESLSWNEVSTGSPTGKPMTPYVALRWANNARGSEDGMTVLYLSEGRPEAVCCVFPWEKTLVHDFSSLSRGTVVVRRSGVVVWRPTEPGVQFRSIPQADAPADTPVARLRQMKELAKLFSSTMLGWNANKSDRESLRLLPRPLYRYEMTEGDITDGAVFAFVQGTDPESLLLIEACQKDRVPEWQYAFVRRTSGELDGRFRDAAVWHAPAYPVNNDPRSNYISIPRPIESTVLDSIKQKEKTR